MSWVATLRRRPSPVRSEELPVSSRFGCTVSSVRV
jgi:hypothetical protein